MGRTYGYGHIYETGKFRGKRALLSLTTGGPPNAYRKGGFNGDIDAILGETLLSDYSRRLSELPQEAPIKVGEY
jgi:putative NADPH-quinone reductase